MEYVTVYNQQGQMLAVLENAMEVGYKLKHNDLWTGQFSLPAADPKNSVCMARNWVRIPDGDRGTGLYRIVGAPSAETSAMGGTVTYQLEHVMATLFDDVLFGYHEVGGTGVSTADVIRYILSKQTVARWQLGTCAFTDYFQYNFENVSLLNALLSLGESLASAFTWVFDTSTTPWTVSLLQADSTTGCGIHYGRNLVSIEKSMDASGLITRLYPLGYGEGVNQLTVRPVNNNLPYIDADTAATWGVVSGVWTDTRIEDPALLLARAQQVLNGYKNPYITYKAKAIDLYQVTGQSWDNYMPGKLVRVMDSEHGISFDARIVEISKNGPRGHRRAVQPGRDQPVRGDVRGQRGRDAPGDLQGVHAWRTEAGEPDAALLAAVSLPGLLQEHQRGRRRDGHDGDARHVGRLSLRRGGRQPGDEERRKPYPQRQRPQPL